VKHDKPRTRIAIVTGTRAEWGLLAPIVARLDATFGCTAHVVAAGAHLLPPALTINDLPRVDARVPMQQAGTTGRPADAAALGRGIEGFARLWTDLHPDWVVVLGDRIEAFAAAAAASVGGIAVAHIHGGDRAEGVADEAMRHAITKLAHLHLAATQQSADRIIRMGERPERVHVVGSPAAVGIEAVAPLDEATWKELEAPELVLLLHPTGRGEAEEHATAKALRDAARGRRTLWIHPNHDPDRQAILDVVEASAAKGWCISRVHLRHSVFRGLLKRLGESGGVLVGNSSAGLIEAALLKCPAVDVGDRQGGRERANNAIHTPGGSARDVASAIDAARALERRTFTHPYGDGRADEHVAKLLMSIDPHDPTLLRKRNTY
jgi:UDP-hydrolysing UDP-N-acetyl-D-glucosamine 2-epimerase